MGRLFTTVLGLVVVALLAPELARLARAAVPALVAVLFLLAIVRLFWPTRRRR